jgi:hypothetical protein
MSYLTQFSGNLRKVMVSREGVTAFNSRWPCSELRDSRHYWFEFDDSRDLVDSDVPEHDDGSAAAAMAEDCKAWLFDDENPEWSPDNDSPVFLDAETESLPIVRRSAPNVDLEGAESLDDEDTRVQRVRDSVLAALDAAALELYGIERHGWKDSELPELFRAVDQQANRMLTRAAAVIREREESRNAAFRACPILWDFVGTMLQDAQLSENDEACTEGREPRDSGTVYTLPDSEFEKCKQLCESFMAEHAADIEAATELEPGQPGLQYTASRYMNHERIGSTLYLAAVGHGVTFTDDGNAPCLERLANAARALRWESPYFGDDGRLYLI